MNFGFDAKRAFHNHTGLGHYSRTLIRSLATHFPEHAYYLFNPKPATRFSFTELPNVKEVLPSGLLNQLFSSMWRSNWVKTDFKKHDIQLYHGLSHEIPFNIHRTGIKTVVTIHDLIHERYPHQYTAIDVRIYTQKFRYACEHADAVIAISEQTKNDIIAFYKTDPSKIHVCYQSCNEAFAKVVHNEEKERVRKQYNLPADYFLYVGSIIERKNLLGICKAIETIKHELPVPLVVIGSGNEYKKIVEEYIAQHQLQKHIIFLSDTPAAKQSASFQNATDFPAIYQLATAMIYPSFFEGFGIPVLEALWSKIPVITSSVSCLPEAGGPGAFYVNPLQPEEIAAQMKTILRDKELVDKHLQLSLQHVQQFSNIHTASTVMNVYKALL